MQIIFYWDDLHEMSMPIFWKKKKKNNISKCEIFTQYAVC